MVRSFEFARKMENGKAIEDKAFQHAKLPQYQTKHAAGADFFCAEEVTIPSIWGLFIHHYLEYAASHISIKSDTENDVIKPTLVHTGIKAGMGEDEVLKLFNRSSGPKRGLILANGTGVVDSDFYENPDDDGEIKFAFFNIKPWPITIKVGDRIGQGVFEKYLRPEIGLDIKNVERSSGFGSTGK